MNEPPNGDFPQIEPADPASVRLPVAQPPAVDAFDTGSDAWFRAQAAAYDLAARPEARPAAAVVDEGGSPPARPAGPPVNGPDADTDELPLPDASAVASSVTSAPAMPRLPLPVASTLASAPAIPRLPRTDVPLRTPSTTVLPAASYAGSGWAVKDRSSPRDGSDQQIGRGGALAGAGLALAGVCLGIGALLWLDRGDSGGGPAVAMPPVGSTGPASSAPSVAPVTPLVPLATATALPGAATPVPTGPPTSLPPAAPARPAVLPVTVLNDSRFSGLAQRAASRFRTGGWSTPVVGNLSGRIRATTVYYAPGQLGSAQRFAKQFGIARVLPRFPGLPGRGLTVVLTRDFA